MFVTGSSCMTASPVVLELMIVCGPVCFKLMFLLFLPAFTGTDFCGFSVVEFCTSELSPVTSARCCS